MLGVPALCWVPPGFQKGSGPFGVLILTQALHTCLPAKAMATSQARRWPNERRR